MDLEINGIKEIQEGHSHFAVIDHLDGHFQKLSIVSQPFNAPILRRMAKLVFTHSKQLWNKAEK